MQRLRQDISILSVWNLPERAGFPKWGPGVFEALKEAGFEGVQTTSFDEPKAAGLEVVGQGLAHRVEDVAALAARWAEGGAVCAAIHVGTGMESDDEVDDLVRAVLDAQERHDLPIHIETHRATLTQDPWRTLRMLERFPEVTLNLDLGHYIAVMEWPYGDPAAKEAFLEPMLDKVRYLHGRIGTNGCGQIEADSHDITDTYRRIWTRAFAGFRATAGPDDVVGFAPELLPHELGYGHARPDGEEAIDRWAESKRLCEIAEECWATSA